MNGMTPNPSENEVPTNKPSSAARIDGASRALSRGMQIVDRELIESLDKYSIEDVVELKISRFLDRMGNFFPENENVYDLIMSKVEKPLLTQVLRRVGGNQVQAAKILGINRNTLRKKMKIYGL